MFASSYPLPMKGMMSFTQEQEQEEYIKDDPLEDLEDSPLEDPKDDLFEEKCLH